MKTQSIFDYLSSKEGDGRGYAILDPRGLVLDPYVYPSDYPNMEVTEQGRGINKYEGYWIHAHDGQLELDKYHFFDGKFTHHVNLDERGSYYADVRNHKGETVFNIYGGNSVDEHSLTDNNIFEDGFMKDKHDMAGLKSYLISLRVMTAQDVLIDLK
jgi:hypothetical protein